MVELELLEEVGPGLMRVRYRIDGAAVKEQIWIRSTRKAVIGTCMICGKSLVGLANWRPSGSPPNRTWRICLEDMKVGRKEVIEQIPT